MATSKEYQKQLDSINLAIGKCGIQKTYNIIKIILQTAPAKDYTSIYNGLLFMSKINNIYEICFFGKKNQQKCIIFFIKDLEKQK